jgi:phage shock protein C
VVKIVSKKVKRLYRSKKEKIIAGVCGGLGDYLNLDPVVIRLAWVLVTIFTGVFPGITAYLIAWAIMPER